MRFWALADYQLGELIEVFATRADAETMLREVLADEPQWASLLEVVPLEIEFSLN